MFVQSISFHLKVGDTSANSHGFIGQFGCRNGMWHETSRICSRDNSEGPLCEWGQDGLCPASSGSIEAVTG